MARKPLTVSVMQIVGVGDSQLVTETAAVVSDRLADGLAKIDKLRVLSPRVELASTSPQIVTARAEPDFVVSGELRLEGGTWTIQARMSNNATGEVRWADSISVGSKHAELSLQQSGSPQASAIRWRFGSMRSSMPAPARPTVTCRAAAPRW